MGELQEALSNNGKAWTFTPEGEQIVVWVDHEATGDLVIEHHSYNGRFLYEERIHSGGYPPQWLFLLNWGRFKREEAGDDG